MDGNRPEEQTIRSLRNEIALLKERLSETEEALTLVQQDLNRAEAVSHTGSWRLDMQHDELLWSDETYRIFGIPKGEKLTYEFFLSRIHPDDRAYVDEKWAAALKGEPYDIEHRILLGDQLKWVRERAELEFHPDGTLRGGFGTVQDITDRKLGEQNLRKLSRAVEQSPSSIVITDTAGRIEYVNPRFTKLTGYTLEEAIGNNPRILKSGLTPEHIYKELWDNLRAGQSWQGEFCNRTKWGELYWENASISPITNKNGVITHYVAVKENITERKRAEKLLQEKAQRLALLSDAARELLRGNDPIALVEGVYARLAALVEIDLYFHYLVVEEEHLLTLSACAGVSESDRARLAQMEYGQGISGSVAQTQQALIFEDIQNSDDERVAEVKVMGVSAYACYPLINQGRLNGILSFGSRRISHFDIETLSMFQAVCDLTAVAIARRKAELALQEYAEQLERSNRDLQEFAFVASHDLQEPLRKIDAFGQLLLSRCDKLDEEHRNYLIRMQQASRRMSRMVEDLLALSRVSTQGKRFQPVDLSEIAADLLSDLEIQLQRTGGKVEIGDLPVIEADGFQMRQLMQNLVSNALKYHRSGVAPLVKITSRQPSWGKVQILVEDNGIGFNEKYRDQIFQPFHRLVSKSSYEGTGMGLAICKKIVERHGGEICANSQPGRGSTFTITLPIKSSQESRS